MDPEYLCLDDQELCAICLEPKNCDYRTPSCNHKFHFKCLNKWYHACYFVNGGDPMCPLCNKRVLSDEHLNVHEICGVYLFNPKNSDGLYYGIECYEACKIANITSYHTNNKPNQIRILESVKEKFKSMRVDSSSSYEESKDILENTEDMNLRDLREYVDMCGYSTATYIYFIETGHMS